MTRKQPRAKVGVIGLGIIGSRVAACLRGAGHQVYVWNRSPRAEPNFLGSAVEVAELSDLLQLFVSDDAALLETVRAIAPVLGPRHLVAGHATVAPATAREAASIVHERGARYLDAPFTGSKAAAQSGQLVYYVAAPEAALREARPLLEVTAKAIVPIGGAPGQASVVKLATNALIASTLQGLAEALALTRAAGVDPAQFSEALENSPVRSGITDNKLPGMIKGNFEPHFALKHLFKDLNLALRQAAVHGVTLPATATVAAAAYGGVQRGWGEQDCSVLAKNYDPPAPVPAAVAATPAPRALPAPTPARAEIVERAPDIAPPASSRQAEEPAAPPPPPLSPAAVEAPPPPAVAEPAAEKTPASAPTTAPTPPLPQEAAATPAPERRTVFPEVPAKPKEPAPAATEKPAGPPADPPRAERGSPTLPALPPVARREPNSLAPVRATAPPAFPFAPPAPRAAGEPLEDPGDREPLTDDPAASPPPPRRSLLSALFGREK